MGAGKRHEEERACPLCIETLDPTEKSFYPCPCGYQVCLFCFDRLKNDCGNLCPGCRTEYGSDTNPFAKRAPSVALPSSATTSQGSRSGSPAAAPVPAAAAPPPMAAPAPARSSNPPPTLQQARQMHRAAQQKLAAQTAAAAAQTAAASQQAAAQPPQQQQPVLPPAGRPASESAHQLSRRGSGRTLLQHSGTLEQQLASACAPAQHASPQQPAAQPPPPARQPPQAAQLQQQQQPFLPPLQQPQPQADYGRMVWPDALPIGGRAPAGASLAYDTAQPLVPQPAQWLPAAAVGVSSLWGNGPVATPAASPAAAPPPPRRTATPLRPLPLQGGPAVEASPGAEAELAGARRAVRNGRLSASDAAWNLLSTRASVRAV